MSQQDPKPAEQGAAAPAAGTEKQPQATATTGKNGKPVKVKPGKRPEAPKRPKPSKPKKHKAVLPSERTAQPQDSAQPKEQPKQ
jgi:hypothetical protein